MNDSPQSSIDICFLNFFHFSVESFSVCDSDFFAILFFLSELNCLTSFPVQNISFVRKLDRENSLVLNSDFTLRAVRAEIDLELLVF